jgi:hypothetical protein
VQRRCKSGKLRARLATTDDGHEWQIEAAALEGADTDDTNDSDGADTSDKVSTSAANVPPTSDEETTVEVSEVSPGAAIVPTGADSAQSTLTAHLLEENRFLRSALEARDRDGAELRAALREALKISSRALVESTSDVAIQRDSTEPKAAMMEVPGATANASQRGAERDGGSAQSTSFERSKGLRAWLLKMLRG